MSHRVFVQGAGALSPLGTTWAETAAALAAGESAVRPIERFDVTGFPCSVGAFIDDRFGQAADRRWELASRAASAAWSATPEAARRGPLGVFVGAESGRASFAAVFALAQAAGGRSIFDHLQFGSRAREWAHQVDAACLSPATVASRLAGRYGATGPAVTVSLACASGLAAVIEAVRAIRLGVVQCALCGGVGADVDPMMLAGFGLLGILSSTGIARPFDSRRDGFVVGEGAAMLVLSTESEGAQAEVVGVGRTLDAHHLTAPHPQGEGAMAAMGRALREAGTDRVEYVQAHGTSTPLNDAVEAKALNRVLGGAIGLAHVASVKGALGHWVAGAGALGFLCGLEAVARGLCLPTANLQSPASDCVLPHLAGLAVRKPVEHALVNAFAFGGANASVVLRAVA